MRILVCGGRDYGDMSDRDHSLRPQREKEYKFIHAELNKLCCKYSKLYSKTENWLPTDIVIISGMARGADAAAADFTIVNYCQLEEYPADWDDLETPPVLVKKNRSGKLYNALAGFARNQRMIDEGKPDLVVAFPGGSGTSDMITRAEKALIEILRIK